MSEIAPAKNDPEQHSFSFAHLSDIHFAGYEEGATFDTNSDIRRELVYDLEEVTKKAGPLDALLIGGDIAGSGKATEYSLAADWIDQICLKFKIPVERVFCVPGNHDVDQATIREDSVLATIQKSLLDCSLEEFDPLLESLLTNGEHCGILLSPLSAYNEFAGRYRCSMALEQQKWEQTLEFGQLKLHIVGLASAIVSGPLDAKTGDRSRLGIGPQARIGRFRDTLVVLLCHHPPNWLRDRSVVGTFLERAHLQLYGHEHSFAMKPSGAGFRIDAGAVHPARGEDPWEPSYNVISLHLDPQSSDQVTIDVYPRRLQEDHTFGPVEGDDMRRESISVGLGTPEGLPEEPVSEPPETDPVDERAIAQLYVGVAPDKRLKIGRELDLIVEEDEQLPEGVRTRKIFDLAREQGRLQALREKLDG